ncbi:MAG: SPOR domain-containing protein [Paracoccus sp. (in: a-proteobacteria)]|nr:SPOR domain-containing protein [Paracoccus sp. (in: a-proteobacteria)]
MAVTDFGAGRFDDSRPYRGASRKYAYQHQAYDDYDEDAWYEEDSGEVLAPPDSIGARLGRVTHYLGALVSVLLMIGLVVWGYKLIVRDVSGIPVIRAMEGDFRTTAENPGGQLGGQTTLAVSQVAGGVSQPAQPQVAIAPAPTGLDESDVTMAELGHEGPMFAPIEDPAQSRMVQLEAQAAAEAVALEDAVPAEDADVAALAGADDLAAAVAEMAAATGAAVLGDEPAAEAAEEAPAIAAISAPRPAPRPASITARAAAAASSPAEAPASQQTAEAAPPAERPAEPAAAEAEPEPAPVQVAAGAPLVQIGAFDSNAIAASEWGRISGRFSSLFSGKSQVIQTTERNGRTFYRLRVAGFESRDDARRFCAALIAEGADCIPAAQ